MKNLIAQLTASDINIKHARATLVGAQIEAAQVNLIHGIKAQILKSETELHQLMDLAPTQTTQLSVGHENFSPGGFVSAIQEKKNRLHELNIQLRLAKETLADWGGETPEQEAPTPAAE